MELDKMYFLFPIIMIASIIVSSEEAAEQGSNSSYSKTNAGTSGKLFDDLHLVQHENNAEKVLNLGTDGYYPDFDNGQSGQQFRSRRNICNFGIGIRCSSCHEVVTCLPGNLAFIRRCNFVFRYCNNGHCSVIPEAKCRPTISTTSSSTTTSTESTTSIPTTTTYFTNITPTITTSTTTPSTTTATTNSSPSTTVSTTSTTGSTTLTTGSSISSSDTTTTISSTTSSTTAVSG